MCGIDMICDEYHNMFSLCLSLCLSLSLSSLSVSLSPSTFYITLITGITVVCTVHVELIFTALQKHLLKRFIFYSLNIYEF